MKKLTALIICACVVVSVYMSCASYGAGGAYSYNNQSEMGGYAFVDLKYAEAAISYAGSLSGNDTQSLGMGFSIKYPFSVWKIELFPLANIEYQRVLGGKETVRNFGWIRFGGGLDFPVTGAFYARSEVMYAPGFISSVQEQGNSADLLLDLSKKDGFSLNPANGFTMRFALGWRPGAAKPARKKEKPAKTNREQTNTVLPERTEKPSALPPAAESGRYREDTTVPVPYKIEGGTTSSWLIFQPSVPNDVPQDIYTRLWNINLKTVKAGKYDFNAFNYNTAQFITYDESALSDNFTFAGVCMNYADYFIFVLKHDGVLLELYNKGIITANTSPSHKWIEYRTENNRYIIDPTWCDWDYVGEPSGIYANNAAFAEACRTSFNRDNLIEAKSRSWFFRNVKTVTEEFDKRAHGL